MSSAPSPSPCQTLGAHKPALPSFPLLSPDLSLSSGLQASCAVSGLVTLREPFLSGYLASHILACPATNLSLSPDGAQGPSRACHVLVWWSLVTCVHTSFPQHAGTHSPASHLPSPVSCLSFAASMLIPLPRHFPGWILYPTHQSTPPLPLSGSLPMRQEVGEGCVSSCGLRADVDSEGPCVS